MPHCLLRQVRLPSLPFEKEGYHFIFEAQKYDDLSQSLILVKFGEFKFFLRKRYRKSKNDFILKCEKISRNLPTGIVKGAIRILALHNQDVLISHNLDNDSLKQKILSPFYKKIEDFLGFSSVFRLEIGFGSGRHLLYQAERNPSVQFIGIEIHTPSIEQVLRQIELRGLQNVLIVNADARVFLELLPSHLCEAIYLHFPVPWGKKPHRRVWSERFIKEALRILKEGGMLELRSDDEGYFLYALEIALKQKNLQCKINKNLKKEIVSKYEDRWLRQHKNIYDLQIFALKEVWQKREQFDFSLDLLGLDGFSGFDTIPKKVVQSDWFLHIDSFYLCEDCCILKLSFGDFNQAQNKFILIDQDRGARYLGGKPLPTLATYKAHKALQKIIKGEDVECGD